jgi:pentatricopeptide repeat protein
MKADDDDAIKKRARMVLHPPPPFHKIPSAVKGAFLSQSRNQEDQQTAAMISSKKSMTKLERELERDWSLSLTAAFAFADSLTHGACGHDPIELNITAWNTLIKACCYRGAFHRALKILNETLPQKGVDPDSISYNTILAGLARVVSL